MIDNSNEPVTVIVAQQVKLGREKDYESWVSHITQVASSYPGYMGTNIVRPQPGVCPEYVVVFRFDCYQHLKDWMSSRDRQYWIDQAKPLIASDAKIQQIGGIEAWFSIPNQGLKPPPRYKMALLTWVVVYILINLLNQLVTPLLQIFPSWLASMIICGIMVILLTYIIMPRITQLFRRWLY